MSHSNDGGPAFAAAAFEHNSSGRLAHQSGMSLRDYFAAKAMQGLLAAGGGVKRGAEEWARIAYTMADAMLKSREGSV